MRFLKLNNYDLYNDVLQVTTYQYDQAFGKKEPSLHQK